MGTPKWPADHAELHAEAARKGWARRQGRTSSRQSAPSQPEKRTVYVKDASDEQLAAMDSYMNAYFQYELGVRPYKVATPKLLTDKQAALARKYAREEARRYRR